MKCRKCRSKAFKILQNNETHERYSSENDQIEGQETWVNNQFGKWWYCRNCKFLFAKEDEKPDEIGDIFKEIYSML